MGLWDFKYQLGRLCDWLALIRAVQRPALLYLFWSLPERQFKSNQQLLRQQQPVAMELNVMQNTKVSWLAATK